MPQSLICLIPFPFINCGCSPAVPNPGPKGTFQALLQVRAGCGSSTKSSANDSKMAMATLKVLGAKTRW